VNWRIDYPKHKRNGQQNDTNSNKSIKKCITRKCVCLADKEQQEVPDREEELLLVAGLGEVKLSESGRSTDKALKRINCLQLLEEQVNYYPMVLRNRVANSQNIRATEERSSAIKMTPF
jgi:hypothetical protein